MLPDPLRPTPSRPPMPEEMEPYLETVFRKVHRTFIYTSFFIEVRLGPAPLLGEILIKRFLLGPNSGIVWVTGQTIQAVAEETSS